MGDSDADADLRAIGDDLAEIAGEAADTLGGLVYYTATELEHDRLFKSVCDRVHDLKESLREAVADWRSARKASGDG